jgi:hypothetical protein
VLEVLCEKVQIQVNGLASWRSVVFIFEKKNKKREKLQIYIL